MSVDEPDHRRLRSLVEKAFVRRNVDQMNERIGVLARQQLDIAGDFAAKNGNGFDFVSQFARPFPLAVICELLGLPDEAIDPSSCNGFPDSAKPVPYSICCGSFLPC